MKTQILLLLLVPTSYVLGQGCIPVRNIVGFGQFMNANNSIFKDSEPRWILNVNTRYLEISRSYVGTERTNLAAEDERINRTFIINLGAVRLLPNGWAMGVDVPIISNSRRTWQEHDVSNAAKIHHSVHSFGIGDIRLTGYKWLWNPSETHRGNIQLGVGLKLPTGDYKYQDYFYKANDQAIVAPVNSTIQLGDGGTGFTTEINAYYNVSPMFSAYGNFFYLINPRDQNGVSSIDGGGTPNEMQIKTGDFVTSVPDSYTARLGVNFSAKKFVFSAGGRIEGQPTYDLVGKSNGTRRAGYTLSIEPGVNYRLRNTILYAFVPLTAKRKTQQTVPDKNRSNIEGKYFVSSGGFADYMIFVGALFKI